MSDHPPPPPGLPSEGPPFQPPLPIAKRLNRNALTVAAVLMGITVLTALVLMRSEADSEASSRAAQDLRPPVPSRPAFLDDPVPVPEPMPELISDSGASGGAEKSGYDSGATGTSSTAHWGYGVTQREHEPAAFGTPGARGGTGGINAPGAVRYWSTDDDAGAGRYPSVPGYAAASAVAMPVSPREAAFRAALASRSVLNEQSSSYAAADTATSATPAVWPVPMPAPASQGTSAPATTGGDPRRAFLANVGNANNHSVAAELEPARSPYTLQAGTIIPGALLTAIDSDLPGDIVAQVTRGVFDSRTQRILLIPRGAKLIGTYDNQIAAGQGRLLVAWTRLILPNGASLTLPGLPLKDPEGRTGARDRVDHHHDRVFGHALLLSAIGAGAQLSQARQQSVFTTPSAGQVAAGAVGQELSNVALEILRRGMDVPPTITIRQGRSFVVFLNGDLVFDGPYDEHSGGGSADHVPAAP